MTLTHISLFAGIDGFGLGFERAGIDTIARVENNPFKVNVLRKHYPDDLLIEDIHDAGKHNLSYADVISFGSPCQDLSIAGKREGLHGDRSKLFFEAIRIVNELRPAFAVWENVPDAISSNNGRDFALVLTAFQECGAVDLAWRTLDAQYFGVPQRRRRIFLVADFRAERSAEILFESASLYGSVEPGATAGEGTATTVSASPPSRRNGGSDPTAGHFVVGTLSSSSAGTARTGNARSEADMLIVEKRRKESDKRFLSFGEYVEDDSASTLKARDGKDATDLILAIDLQQVTSAVNRSKPYPQSPAITTNSDIIAFNWNAGVGAGLSSGRVAPTLRRGHHNHPAVQSTQTGVRRLTPTECGRLQGFPDGWCSMLSDTRQYEAYGEAVAVPVAEWLGRRIVKYA